MRKIGRGGTEMGEITVTKELHTYMLYSSVLVPTNHLI